jgi:Peroxidase
MHLSNLLVMITASYGQILIQQDFQQLKAALVEFILEDPQTRVPSYTRIAFHDLANGFGPHGCFLHKSVQELEDNAGMGDDVKNLAKYVKRQFPHSAFSFGDVISLAGKVAVETAYPCVNVRWRFGRSRCPTIANPGPFPDGSSITMNEIHPFLVQYGFTPQEMAILIAGAHGMAFAAATPENSGFGTETDTFFATINSGKDWIVRTMGHWNTMRSPDGLPQLISGNLMRLPIDLLFFPSVADQYGGPVGLCGDPAARPYEAFMRSFAHQDRTAFDQQFALVFSKMLEIGLNAADVMIPFLDTSPIGQCLPDPVSIPQPYRF